MGTQHSPVTPARRRWLSPRAVTGLILAVLAVVLAVENRQLVEIRLFVPLVTMPLWTALAVLLIIGVIIGFLVARPRK
ncbi:LapA family protein [Saccharopolyspora sp. 5N708]|uniref:LapA family protein n=1 Tax=Saccharopolyspora sp. 5N708 TaxID=3457424 RepID=UPI003FD041A2